MPIYNYPQLIRLASDPVKFVNFLIANGLIKRTQICPRRHCRRRMSIQRDKTFAECFRFRCCKCRSTKSIRTGSFFEESKLSVAQILQMTYCWAAETTVKNAVRMSDVC